MELTLRRAKENFLAALTLEGKSPETILWHNKKLTAFLAFMETTASEVRIRDLAVDDARSFVRSLMERTTKYANHKFHRETEGGLAPQTIHGYVRSLKTFAAWLAAEGYTSEHIFERLQPPKVPQVLIEPLTEDEIRRLLVAIPVDTPEGARNYAMLALFLDTGMRLSELVNLELGHVDFAAGQLKVFGKGAKERIVPMGVAARRALVRYCEHARPQPNQLQQRQVFLNMAGDPISRDAVEKIMQRLSRRTRIPRLHPHLLRHTFAVRYLMNGGDVFTLQKILGHTSLEMTRKYVTLASGDVKERHRLSSPIDNLGLVEKKRGRPRRQPGNGMHPSAKV
ncbi:MAG: tyrosine-type recombinase/integrase [Anaerolineales bacterium]|nr:tyrosine-type recombinase/integrase [Anaerolineales bacterium]